MGLALLAAVFYAAAVEPYWIEVARHQVRAPVPRPLRLVLLCDLHTSGFGRLEAKTLELVAREKPDAILVAGDGISGAQGYPGALKFLQRLQAPLGVWAVRGNWENWTRRKDEPAFYREAGVGLLVNETVALAPGVTLTGYDDAATGRPDLDRAARGLAKSTFSIALFHSPRFFDRVTRVHALCLAGHTHGGQFRLPGLGPLWLPAGSSPYVAGWYRKEGSALYVSRGVGGSLLPIRFLCRPEIAVFDLVPD